MGRIGEQHQLRAAEMGDRHDEGGARDPVSYTHHRAHETVLDLVCRLLLEKKKKQLTPILHTDKIVTANKNAQSNNHI